jgi:hypothetical protein
MSEIPILTFEALEAPDARVAALRWRLPDNPDPLLLKVTISVLADYLDDVGDKFGYFSDERNAVVERLLELADRQHETGK